LETICKPSVPEDDYEVIFVASYWNKRAKRRITAAQLGLRAIPLKIRRKA
jgi:hypothetical protein